MDLSIPNPVQLSTGLGDGTWYSSALMEYIHLKVEETTTQLISPTTKGLINAYMELVGSGFSKKVKNHWAIGIRKQKHRLMQLVHLSFPS